MIDVTQVQRENSKLKYELDKDRKRIQSLEQCVSKMHYDLLKTLSAVLLVFTIIGYLYAQHC